MAVPDYQTLMLPVLKSAANGEVRISDVVRTLADQLGLSDEDRAELLPSGRQRTFDNRVHWAKSYLVKAGLLEITRRAHFQITDRGRQALASDLDRIDIHYLSQFPEFREFRSGSSSDSQEVRERQEPISSDERTPDEVMRAAHREIERALRQELLDRVMAAPPEFFESLVVNLLVSMGYGGSLEDAGQELGRSGDGGVDGVIDQDALGLDRVYIQAKRYQPGNPVTAGQIRDFFGSLRHSPQESRCFARDARTDRYLARCLMVHSLSKGVSAVTRRKPTFRLSNASDRAYFPPLMPARNRRMPRSHTSISISSKGVGGSFDFKCGSWEALRGVARGRFA